MDGDDLRSLALGFPEVTERETWGHPTFRVGDKILADTFSPAVHGGQHGWVQVQLATVDGVQLRELLADAWRIVAPKRLVAELDSGSGRVPE